MTQVARITKHPTDRDCVLLHVAPDANDRLGKFGPARLSPDHHAFVIHHSHIDALYRYARTVDLHVVDERGRTTPVFQVKPIECRSCGVGASRGNPPVVCPSCGERWHGVEPPLSADPIPKTKCHQCGHRQNGRFPYCATCGTPMTYAEPSRREPLPRTESRPKLDDPIPFGQAVETYRQEAHRSQGVTHPPYLPPRDSETGRDIDDVALPDPTDGNDPWYRPEPEQTPDADDGDQPWCAEHGGYTCTHREPDPARVERQHMVNAATAAIRHQPVPSRDVAVQQVIDGDETIPTPGPVQRCDHCGRLPSQPHDETCPTREADPTQEEPSASPPSPESNDQPTVEDPPYSPHDNSGWSWG